MHKNLTYTSWTIVHQIEHGTGSTNKMLTLNEINARWPCISSAETPSLLQVFIFTEIIWNGCEMKDDWESREWNSGCRMGKLATGTEASPLGGWRVPNFARKALQVTFRFVRSLSSSIWSCRERNFATWSSDNPSGVVLSKLLLHPLGRVTEDTLVSLRIKLISSSFNSLLLNSLTQIGQRHFFLLLGLLAKSSIVNSFPQFHSSIFDTAAYFRTLYVGWRRLPR